MKMDATDRLLGIGEFAAATQLSLRALRLYDEQCLLRPATVDTANGYRYYRHDQIATGRLIRLLRDMELPLAAVSEIVAGDSTQAEALLRRYTLDLEQRFARQRRAFRAALGHLRHVSPTGAPAIELHARHAGTIAVRSFLADRRSLLQRFRGESAAMQAVLAETGIPPVGKPECSLLDPLSEEEGQIELRVPIPTTPTLPNHVAVRQQIAASRAVIVLEFAAAEPVDLTAGIDTLFDWFDRHGRRALEPPAIAFETRATGVSAEIRWAYE